MCSDIKSNFTPQIFKTQCEEMDLKYGKVKSYMITKFNTCNSIQKDGTSLPLVHFTLELKRDSLDYEINLRYNLNNKVKGILDMDI